MSIPDKIKYPEHPSTPVRGSTKANKYWPEDKTFKIAFLNGSSNQQDKVKMAAEAWRRIDPDLTFKWVNGGIHGDVRIAFDDDTIKNMSWSQVGTDSTEPLIENFPETTHFSQIRDTPVGDISELEKIIIEHEFGHIFGFQFAPNYNYKDLSDWRKSVGWDTWMGNTVPTRIRNCLKSEFGDPEPVPEVAWASNIKDPIIDQRFNPDSVMVFDWRNRISANDANVFSEHYPFPIRAITFGTQDAFDRSMVYPDQVDLVLYAVSFRNTLNKNTRRILKAKATDKAKVSWTGWEQFNGNDGNSIKVPLGAQSLVALDFPDRLEFFVACNGTLQYRHMKKDNVSPWDVDWQTVKHGPNDLKLLNPSGSQEPTTFLRAVEVDGGINVFFITDKGALGTIYRKAGEMVLPTNFHPVTGAKNIVSITGARIGPPTITNPPRIVAATKDEVFLSAPSRTMHTWDVTSSGADDGVKIFRLATGMAGDTHHILVIGEDRYLYQNMNKDGWLSWNDGFNQMKPTDMPMEGAAKPQFVSISVGVVASNDQEDGYLYAFAVSENGNLWASKVDDTNNWSPWTQDVNNIGALDPLNPPNPKIEAPENVRRVIARRTRSGDLEVFLFVQDPKNPNRNVLCNLYYNYGVSAISKEKGFQKVWWDPRVQY